MNLESLYQELILENYKNQYKNGLKDDFEKEVHHVNTTCGDEITLRLKFDKIQDKNDLISYESQGCAISQASTSIMAKQLENKSFDEINSIIDEFNKMIKSKGQNIELNEELLGDGIALASVSKFPARVKCALLGWKAYEDALTQIIEKG